VDARGRRMSSSSSIRKSWNSTSNSTRSSTSARTAAALLAHYLTPGPYPPGFLVSDAQLPLVPGGAGNAPISIHSPGLATDSTAPSALPLAPAHFHFWLSPPEHTDTSTVLLPRRASKHLPDMTEVIVWLAELNAHAPAVEVRSTQKAWEYV
jgi:hypothetical protein